MKTLLSMVMLCFLAGCETAEHKQGTLHDMAHRARPPVVDIAVNLGLKHEDDLRKLYDSLASEGVRCGMRAMSLDAEQIVVERADFERAKTIVTSIITRERLTVRVYKSPGFEKAPANSLLEVWDKGQKVREEEYRLYLSPYTGEQPSRADKK
jgi:hypothetical protein